jgi:hypothetical protein
MVSLTLDLTANNENVLHVINAFVNLTGLEFYFTTMPSPTFASAPALIMPCVRHFELWWHWNTVPPALAIFLGSCRFHTSCAFDLEIVPMSATQSLALNPLFEHHVENPVMYLGEIDKGSNILHRTRWVRLSLCPPLQVFHTPNNHLPRFIMMYAKVHMPLDDNPLFRLLDFLLERRRPGHADQDHQQNELGSSGQDTEKGRGRGRSRRGGRNRGRGRSRGGVTILDTGHDADNRAGDSSETPTSQDISRSKLVPLDPVYLLVGGQYDSILWKKDFDMGEEYGAFMDLFHTYERRLLQVGIVLCGDQGRLVRDAKGQVTGTEFVDTKLL